MPKLHSYAVMDDGMRKWMFQHAHKNLWRVSHWLNFEDLIQEGYACFAKARLYYGDTVESRGHFMSLFRTIYTNRINDLANDRSVLGPDEVGLEQPISWLGPAEGRQNWLDGVFGSCEQEGPTAVLMREARYPIRSVIALFTTEQGSEILRRHPQKRRESLNGYLCRLVGADPAVYDLPEMFKSFLSGMGMYNLKIPSAPLALAG